MDARKYLRENWLPLACFLVGLIIVWGQLRYPTHWLSEWDESQYINSGRALAHGRLPILALNPFLALFYFPLFEIFKHQPMWLFEAATWGHRILYAGLWVVLLLIGGELLGPRDRIALAVWPIVTAAFAALVSNSSDAAFAIFSGLAFWQLMRFRNSEKVLCAALIGVFVGIAALCRADGIILVFLVGSMLIGILYQRDKLKLAPPVAAAVLLPFMLILGVDLMVQHRTTGEWYLGIKPRSYVAFEQGQGVVYADKFKDQNPMSAGMAWSQKLYGTISQNHSSILNAAIRNPSAFMHRVSRQADSAPGEALAAYSDTNIDTSGALPITGLALLIMVAVGAWKLKRIKQTGLLAMCLLWTSSLLLYVITFYRPGYFLTACFPLFVVAAFGLASVIQAVEDMFPGPNLAPAAVGFPALILGLVAGVGRGIPSPRTYQVTESELVSAVNAIRHAAPNNSGVVSSAPQLAFLAQKPWIDASGAPRDAAHFKSWAIHNQARAMVLDGRLEYDNPILYSTLEKVAPKLGKAVPTESDNFKVYKLPQGKAAVASASVVRKQHKRSRHRHRGRRRHRR